MPIDRWMRRTAALLLAALAAGAGQAAELALVGARIYPAPEAAPIERGTVLVREGRIVAVGPAAEVAVPPGATRLDAAGKVVVAGYWNSHVHMLPLPLREAATRPAAELGRALEATFTRYGFTTVFDIGSIPGNTFALRRRVEAGEFAGPAILTVDGPFFPKDGTPVYVRELFRQIGAPDLEVASAEAARGRAAQQLRDGADGVKLFVGAIVAGGVVPMDRGIAAALVAEAHRAGKPAFAHPTLVEGLEIALAAGVDVLAHTTPTDGPWSPALAARLVAARIALTPTLTLIEEEVTKDGAPSEVVRRIVGAAQQQLGAFAQAGGEVLFGTDVGYIETADLRREFVLMAGAGLSWRQILASLTQRPAARFGRGEQSGRIAPGMEADLVVLDRDPAADVAAFADVRWTIRAGRVIHDAASSPAR